MARFFIDRPIFAWVISIVIMLAGLLAIRTLPIAQYPDIAPPTVSISASYPGASAKTIEDSVTQVIEQKMKGIDHLEYISSNSAASGSARIELTFSSGADPDIAQVQVQNKLQLAMSQLPQTVQSQGVTVTKSGSSYLMVFAFTSDRDDVTNADLADFVASRVQDPISRVDGVGEANLFGAQYAMRIWLDPDKLVKYALTPADVKTAIEAQNTQIAVGQLGDLPAVNGQALNATINARGRLQTPEQFSAIVLRTGSDGSTVRLSDVARVEIGAESYSVLARYNGRPSAGLGIRLASGANALQVAEAAEAKLKELSRFFPAGMHAVVANDTSPFVRLSIEEVVKTLVEAMVLVFAVMYLFLQSWRATLIPAVAVPVVLLGTFAVLEAFGFSINTLTLFAMVLAIGLLVDDAIVVVENVERLMAEEGLSPLEATRKSMDQISGALVGIALVLSAVFVPMAFIESASGIIYRQFSVTIVAAMALSVLVALTLSPALCANLLRPLDPGGHHAHRGLLGRFFGLFNRGFERSVSGYTAASRGMIRRPLRSLLVYALIIGGLGTLFARLPTSFLPDEDQGSLLVQITLPVGATQSRALNVIGQVEKYFLENEKDTVRGLFGVSGSGFGGNGQSVGIAFIKLRDWSERNRDELRAPAIVARAMKAFASIRDARVFVMNPPQIRGLGNSTGFDVQMQDSAGIGHDALIAARNRFLELAQQDPVLTRVRPQGMDDTPQLQVDIDTAKAGALGLAMSDINSALGTALGGSYVNDFIDRGRVKKVYVQGDAPFRMLPEDINRWYVRNSAGQMVSFADFSRAYWSFGSPRLERYNGSSSIELVGEAAPGYSSGEAMNAVERIMAQMPQGISYEWTGLSRQERISGDQAPLLYAISILVVFLALAALYESWSIPFSVMLVVPLGVFGALLATTLRGLENDVYFQVGLLTTIGLSAKNAILIAEFAHTLQQRGMDLVEATLHAAHQRLRPIVMTSLAFILGVLPLALSTGAGSGSRRAIGTGVMGGMISATVLAIFFVPLFFVLVRRYLGGRQPAPAATPSPIPASGDAS
ncbi:efflux RND transporter permease subunit [Plasticicumulans acidivorans]|uniref:Efflux pump membrane transporter n=1 Tax=Plasticicumulans acidivorans TaxID=886464 RepID=A0A317MS54_9GAMM|nr:efflux RND transporter permease subunit [Plasticicumulans acidivorans]PWV59806.1 multidrug efflux pump [Plasticicumulans acidivorans]